MVLSLLSDDRKDHSIRTLLEGLVSRLGPDRFQLVDHWEIDRCAIGVACRADATRLVYISTWKQPSGACVYECEVSTDGPAGHIVVEAGEAADVATLAAIVCRHLQLAPAAADR